MSSRLSIMQYEFPTPWQFWFIQITNEAYKIEEIIKVDTAQNFFIYLQKLPKMSEIRCIENKRPQIALFRDKIRPAWEDENNKYGAILKFDVSCPNIDSVFLYISMWITGETILRDVLPDDVYQNEVKAKANSDPNQNNAQQPFQINGIIVSHKNPKYYALQLWVNSTPPDINLDQMGDKICDKIIDQRKTHPEYFESDQEILLRSSDLRYLSYTDLKGKRK